MINKNVVVNGETKSVLIKHSFPATKDFIKIFNSVGWERTAARVNENKKHSVFAVGLYIENNIVGMGRVVGDGAYFTIYDVVVDKLHQRLGLGSIILKEIVEWYKTIEDDDTFLYVNASKNKERFYEKFGFVPRPNDEVGAGMKYYGG